MKNDDKFLEDLQRERLLVPSLHQALRGRGHGAHRHATASHRVATREYLPAHPGLAPRLLLL